MEVAAAIMAAVPKVIPMRKRLLIFVPLFVAGLFAQTPAWPPSSDHLTLPLWPGGAPDAQPVPEPEGDLTTAKDGSPGGRPVIRIGNVSTPTLTLYTPKGNNTGA